MKDFERELGAEISKAVEQIVAASHAAATKALGEAFGRGQPERRARSPKAQSDGATRSLAPRRTQEEIAQLKSRLYQAICEQPGQAMSALAPVIASTPVRLQLPVARLKADGLIKTVGQRHLTRYFPLGGAVGAG